VKPHEKIEQLKRDGLQVHVAHFRTLERTGALVKKHELSKIFLSEDVEPPRLSPKGGYTKVTVRDPFGGRLATGYAWCSKLDNFNKRTGLTIALGRALKALNSLPAA